jgi:glycine oxidase
MPNSKKTIIVGGGIAGLCLAHHLEQGKIPFVIIDKGINHSSKVAAGIINPVVFRRMALSWRVAGFLPKAIHFYTKLEEKLKINFFHSITIRRAFAHQQEVDLWNEKIKQNSHKKYLQPIENNQFDYLNQPFGSGEVKNCFWIDTHQLLNGLIAHYSNMQNYFIDEFNYEKIDLSNSKYSLSNGEKINFERIIFCEGYHGLNNPYFNYLPLQATKGELLNIKSKSLPETESLNYKCFVLPIGNHVFKVGATYEWDSPNIEISEKAKNELEQHFNKLVNTDYEIIKHEAGVRPTVLDRRPLIGTHPKHNNLLIFNGLGAKGYLIAPKLAEEFVEYLFDGKELDPEIDIKRYE